MTVTEVQVKTEEFNPTGLTLCDGCGSSKAYVRFYKGDTDFLFCAHHTNRHELALISLGYQMTDRRDILDAEIKAYNTVNPDDDNF